MSMSGNGSTPTSTLLASQVADRTAVVGVLGLGYVGLPLCTELARAGFRVIGFDVDPQVVATVNDGASHIADVESRLLGALVGEGLLTATTDMTRLAEKDKSGRIVSIPFHPL